MSLQSAHALAVLVPNQQHACRKLRVARTVFLSSNSRRSIHQAHLPSVFCRALEKQVSAEFQTSVDSIVGTRFWKWKDHTVRYQVAGLAGPALVLIHGFGANCDHWRKNLPVLARQHRVFAIDLLGYGYSSKPNPRDVPSNSIYNFENWGNQVLDFISDIVKDDAFLVCNSVGGIVGLQAALLDPSVVKGLVLLNISLRMLHIKKQRWYVHPFVKSFQNLMRSTDLGKRFFKVVATQESVKRILCECYHDDSAVTDELVEKILLPGLQPGAIDVFLDFICYSGGPLPEEMLHDIKCPVLIGWGEKDPWEPLDLGKAYGSFQCVEDFVVFPNVGHCPQDEAPHLVNPMIEEFVARQIQKRAYAHCSCDNIAKCTLQFSISV